MTRSLKGRILTPAGLVDGTLRIGADGRIAAVEGEPASMETVRDGGTPIFVPGFVDLHVHGGAGRDIMEGGDAALQVTRRHAEHGTTALLATTMTAPLEDLRHALGSIGEMVRAGAPGTARVLGVHLEGPYINKGKLGAQPDYARPVSLAELKELDALAPEVPGNLEAIPQLVAAGFRVQIGHTLGTYEDGVEALQRGARGFTHLFNAMTPLHHRMPGMVGAALAHARFAEVIPDLLHVHPGAIRAALRSIPCLYCVTDSTAATGMPDGEYRLGRQAVTKCLGGVRLADGTLAGSTLTMDRALRNLVDVIGLPLDDAARRVATFPADFLELPERGRLQAGAWADVVVLDRDLHVQEVFVEGGSLDVAHAR